jgi:hypothetical protein
MENAEKKELKIGPRIAPLGIFTIENGYLTCRTLYKQLFKVRLADVQIVTVDVGGLLGTKGTLRLIGGGVNLAAETFVLKYAEEARDWIQANK